MIRRWLIPLVLLVALAGWLIWRSGAREREAEDAVPEAALRKSDRGRGKGEDPFVFTYEVLPEPEATPELRALLAKLEKRRAEWEIFHGDADHVRWELYITEWADFAWDSTDGLSEEELTDLIAYLTEASTEVGCFLIALKQRLTSLAPEASMANLLKWAREEEILKPYHENRTTRGELGHDIAQNYHDAMAGWARVDPAAAWRRYDEDRRDQNMEQIHAGYHDITPFPIFREWARMDPEQALAALWREENLDHFFGMQEGFFSGVAGGQDWVAIGNELIRFFDEHEENGLTDTGGRYLVLRWIEEDPAAALGWYVANVKDTIQVAHDPLSLQGDVLARWFFEDPVEAQGWMMDEARAGNAELTTAFLLHAITSSEISADQQRELLNLVAQLPEAPQRGEALRQLASEGTERDPFAEDAGVRPVTGGGSSIHDTRVLLGRIDLLPEDRAAIEAILAERERKELERRD